MNVETVARRTGIVGHAARHGVLGVLSAGALGGLGKGFDVLASATIANADVPHGESTLTGMFSGPDLEAGADYGVALVRRGRGAGKLRSNHEKPVALAALPRATGAGKKAKTCRKNIRNAVKKTCGKQVAECEVALTILNPGKIACCQHLRHCDFEGHIQCVV